MKRADGGRRTADGEEPSWCLTHAIVREISENYPVSTREPNLKPSRVPCPLPPVSSPSAVRRPPITSSGFTLIEVLAALVIVSLGMLGVIQAVSQTASNTTYLRDKTIAHWVAMNRLTEARLQPQAPKVDKSSDEVEMAGQRWRWTMTVTQSEVESIRRIDISVRPADADEASSMASITGFYGAALAPPGTTLIAWQGAEGGGRPRQRDRDGQEETPQADDPAGDPGDSGDSDEQADSSAGEQ